MTMADKWMVLLISSTLKSTLILLAGSLVVVPLRRASAATRHLILTAAIVCALAVPFCSLLLPAWETKAIPLPVANTQLVVAQAAPATHITHAEEPVNWANVVLVLWIAGVVTVAGRVLIGITHVRSIAVRANRRALPAGLDRTMTLGREPILLESSEVQMPLTMGVFRPLILVPTAARTWPAERFDAVLVHELSHVRRADWVSDMLAHAACAVYWFNPLVWLAAHLLRKEREHACDDAVLNLGYRASEYAEHLVGVVRSVADRKPAWTSAVAMAQPSQLENRLMKLLMPNVDRRGLSRKGVALSALAAAMILIPLASMRAPAQNSANKLFGTVYDASGAVVPSARVTVSSLENRKKETTMTSEGGEYAFNGIAAGRYSIEVAMPGFKLYKAGEIALQNGGAVQTDVRLEIGGVSENVEVVGNGTPQATTYSSGPPTRIRVGGNVQATKLVRQVRPVYPDFAKQQGIEGTVLINAVIGTDGGLLNAEVINTLVDADLAKAALDAVQQWRYEPTRLNGQPVEVITTISVNFRLARNMQGR